MFSLISTKYYTRWSFAFFPFVLFVSLFFDIFSEIVFDIIAAFRTHSVSKALSSFCWSLSFFFACFVVYTHGIDIAATAADVEWMVYSIFWRWMHSLHSRTQNTQTDACISDIYRETFILHGLCVHSLSSLSLCLSLSFYLVFYICLLSIHSMHVTNSFDSFQCLCDSHRLDGTACKHTMRAPKIALRT